MKESFDGWDARIFRWMDERMDAMKESLNGWMRESLDGWDDRILGRMDEKIF